MRLAITKAGLRVDGGWQVACAACGTVAIFVSRLVRVELPFLCAGCSTCAEAKRCDRDALTHERRAAKARREADEHAKAGRPAWAETLRVQADRDEREAKRLRLCAEAWRLKKGAAA